MASLLGLGPTVEGYQGAIFNSAVYWDLGKAGGFTFEPRLSYSFISFFGAGTGNAFAAGITAGAAGFSVKAQFDVLSSFETTRTFLTLGVKVVL